MIAPRSAMLPRSTATPPDSAQCPADRPNDVRVFVTGAGNALRHGPPATSRRSEVKQFGYLVQQRRQSSGIKEVLHQMLTGGHQIQEKRSCSPKPIPVFQCQGNARSPGQGQEVQYAVGRSPNGCIDHNSVLKGLTREQT